MIGMKLMATGLLLVFTASIFIKAIGKFPGPVVGVSLVLAWFGGAAGGEAEPECRLFRRRNFGRIYAKCK